MSMNIPPHPELAPQDGVLSRLLQTRAAFDSVAADYDGPRGNNELIQDMRTQVWQALDGAFPAPSRLIDLGCGTGLDAVRMARLGHHVTATDWSPRMVERTRARAQDEDLSDRVQALHIGAHELERIPATGQFDGLYSNLGPLNCVPDPAALADQCARLLRPAGVLVFAVIGRFCPWEMGYFAGQRNWPRLRVRFARRMVPVNMNKQTVWTRYYTPREFYRPFARHFVLRNYRGLCVFAPPPYLTGVRHRHPRLYERLMRWDQRAAGWPLIRNLGDHFLIVMVKR